MEFPKEDPNLKDINSLFEDGFVEFIFPENEDITDRPERVRSAYANSWPTIQDFLLDQSADWRTLDSPMDRLLGLHSRICDMEDLPHLAPYLHVAYMGLYNETTSHMINGILFDNVEKGTYAIDSIRDGIEHTALGLKFEIPSEEIARFIMNFASSLHLSKILHGEQSIPDRLEIEMAIIDYLSSNLAIE
ncbi:MAG: hypothetical protein V4611_04495 [Patescibacteria group bacterium]